MAEKPAAIDSFLQIYTVLKIAIDSDLDHTLHSYGRFSPSCSFVLCSSRRRRRSLPCASSYTVEDIFKDFTGRRSGLLQALTTDSDSLYLRCSPARSNLSIWGYPNGTWRVFVPEPKLPPDTPEPLIGINFCRDGMRRQDWLAMIAAHSNTWLLSLAYYFLAAAKLGADERKRLFGLINDLPTLFEVVKSR